MTERSIKVLKTKINNKFGGLADYLNIDIKEQYCIVGDIEISGHSHKSILEVIQFKIDSKNYINDVQQLLHGIEHIVSVLDVLRCEELGLVTHVENRCIWVNRYNYTNVNEALDVVSELVKRKSEPKYNQQVGRVKRFTDNLTDKCSDMKTPITYSEFTGLEEANYINPKLNWIVRLGVWFNKINK